MERRMLYEDRIRRLARTPLKFPIGEVLCSWMAWDHCSISPLVEVEPNETLEGLLARHFCGDWGNVPEDWRRRMDQALRQGQKVLSCFRLPKPRTDNLEPWLCIFTSEDRSTTVARVALREPGHDDLELSSVPYNEKYMHLISPDDFAGLL